MVTERMKLVEINYVRRLWKTPLQWLKNRSLVRFILAIQHSVARDNLSLISAGVAFYGFLSIFPAIAAGISIYGLVSNPENIQSQLSLIDSLLPPDVLSLIENRLHDITSNTSDALTTGVVVGILLSLWSANKAMKAIAQALNIAHDRKEKRSFIRVNIVTLGLTLFSVFVFLFGFTAIIGVPIVVNFLLTYTWAEVLTAVLCWSVFIGTLMALFCLLYRFAPSSPHDHWRKLLPGALMSTVFFISASILFSVYVGSFGSYDKQYGALGAVVIMLFWLYIGSFIFLLGAEINAYRLNKDVLHQMRGGLD